MFNKYKHQQLADQIAVFVCLPLMGKCETCSEIMGNRVYPCYDDVTQAVTESYISCKPCFSAVWAGEF